MQPASSRRQQHSDATVAFAIRRTCIDCLTGLCSPAFAATLAGFARARPDDLSARRGRAVAAPPRPGLPRTVARARTRPASGGRAMFTGIVTDVGTVERLEDRGDLRARIRCGYAAERHRARRLDRLRRHLPDRRRPRPGRRRRLVRRRPLGRDRGAHQRPPRPHRLGRRAAASTSSARSGSATSSAATSSRATSTASPRCIERRARGRQRPLPLPRPRRARPLHRAEGLGRAERHLADRQRGRGRELRRQPDPAHPRRSPPGARSAPATSSTSRSTRWRATSRG